MIRTSLCRFCFLTLCLPVLLTVFGAAQETHLTLDDGVEKLAGLDAVYERFTRAYRELDADLFRQIYTQNALYLSPGSDVRKGLDAFSGGFRGMFERAGQQGQVLNISFRILDRQVSEGLATDVGIYTLLRKEEGETVHRSRGKFIVVALKQDDGSWLFHVDGYSGMPSED